MLAALRATHGLRQTTALGERIYQGTHRHQLWFQSYAWCQRSMSWQQMHRARRSAGCHQKRPARTGCRPSRSRTAPAPLLPPPATPPCRPQVQRPPPPAAHPWGGSARVLPAMVWLRLTAVTHPLLAPQARPQWCPVTMPCLTRLQVGTNWLQEGLIWHKRVGGHRSGRTRRKKVMAPKDPRKPSQAGTRMGGPTCTPRRAAAQRWPASCATAPRPSLQTEKSVLQR